jgi:ATP-dependent Lon protease
MSATTQRLNVLALRDTILLPGTVGSLIAGRKISLEAIDAAVLAEEDVFLLAQKDASIESPAEADLFEVGIVARILQVLKLPDNAIKLLVEAKYRAQRTRLIETPVLSAELECVHEVPPDEALVKNYRTVLASSFEEYLKMSEHVSSEAMLLLKGVEDLGLYADTIASHLLTSIEEKQMIVETLDVTERIKSVIKILKRETEWLHVENDLRLSVKEEIEADQTAYVKEKRLKAIQRLLEGQQNDSVDELEQLRQAIEALPITKGTKSKLLSDCDKLKTMPAASAEATVIRTHLDWIVEVPWTQQSKVNIQIKQAEKRLNQDHYGLEKVKERILEHIAVQIKSTAPIKGPILCLVGPPGVGKTSLGQSIANAMGREFVRIALGGVRDEAEIRGHRKTYIGAMPGRIIKAMKRAGVVNPLILLDEVDKMGMDFRGDPASALLEVLDPEQNFRFNDHYLEVDYDLSQVMFLTTANTTEIPAALLDRMEVIRLSSYTEEEKLKISKRFLMEKCSKAAGLNSKELHISETAMRQIIRGYTQEAGVREVERLISKVCRKVTKSIVDKTQTKSCTRVTVRQLTGLLGVQRYDMEQVFGRDQVGLVHGMAWTAAGGVLLTIEAIAVLGKGKSQYTGSLGEVMKESMQAALSVMRSRAEYFGVDPVFLKTHDLHVHVPEGATPKDGPSAGIAVCTALISVMTGVSVKSDVVMTGEITLRGEVLKIGGLKEKLLAAIRVGAKIAIIPKANLPDVSELKSLIQGKLTLCPVQWIDEVLKIALVELPVAEKSNAMMPCLEGQPVYLSEPKSDESERDGGTHVH